MAMKMQPVWIAACVCCGLAGSTSDGAEQPKKLYAPGYYIAVSAAREYEGAVRVRGASNLPVGAKIGLEVEELVPENGRKPLSTLTCVAVDQRGLFRAELQITKDVYQKKDLVVDAIFLTNQCAQDQEVIRVVGRHGELLGNDGRPVTMEEVERGETPGMQENPELFQVSGWYFGISAIARVD
jgi:hypothetical protein